MPLPLALAECECLLERLAPRDSRVCSFSAGQIADAVDVRGALEAPSAA